MNMQYIKLRDTMATLAAEETNQAIPPKPVAKRKGHPTNAEVAIFEQWYATWNSHYFGVMRRLTGEKTLEEQGIRLCPETGKVLV